MYRSDAHLILINKGFTHHEASRILEAVMRNGYALTVPRDLPSLHVDVDASGMNFRIIVNDTGAPVIL